MNCPVCNVELRMGDRFGIELDYCPQCRGVWLEKGKLDRIIEKAAAPRPEPYGDAGRESERRFGYRGDREYEHEHEHGHHGRKRSFLSNLFD